MENKRPLSPHIQIYRWHVSSLVSISHRITGIINIIAITLICLWVSLIFISENNYEMINLFLSSKILLFISVYVSFATITTSLGLLVPNIFAVNINVCADGT